STSAKVDFTPTAPNLNAEKKLRIAVIENYVNEASAEVKAALLKSIEMLKANGHEIVYKNMLDSKFD
ncbi:Asp-tRNA(Asn)/Glu-tRNA(Gln) amidotransferase subunit GatA, partial [Campylobacter jejuni]|nr:Asp-tRNA(Asn)/Glu-tRNA(Gln) amidotransferase subunit GatA [Campylobacter jejuni]